MEKLLGWLIVILLTVVTVLSAGCPDYGPTDESAANVEQVVTTEISMLNSQFEPQNIRVAAGETITWTNDDSVTHTATADNGEFDSGHLEPGNAFSHVFEEPGTYDYRCTIHPTMVGTITVQ